MWLETQAIRARGFTLVEMIIVIVIVGAIFAVGSLVLGRTFESYALTRQTADVDWQGRVAMERMVRELREIRSATSADLSISATSTNPIYFYSVDGSPICFVLSSGSLRRGVDAPGAGGCATSLQPLADNVTANGLNFYYYRNDGVATSTPSEVFFITVTLAVTEGGIGETYRATVQPRRF